MIGHALVDELRTFPTPSILNGLKRLGHPPERFETMDRHAIHCISPSLGVCVGFAATRKVATRRGGGPSTAGPGELDGGLLSVPAPRVLVVENVGDWRGPVCIWGELGANINLAFGCVGGITNGPVRDVPEMTALGFHTFAGGVGPGGGYVDGLEIGGPVEVGGVTVRPGDLIHADQHGIIKIPLDLAERLPDAIRAHDAYERRVIAACRSPDVTPAALAAVMAAG
jgi:4-hydroxy-4-methyl-2-oxoglutarate aldolase